MSVQPQDQAKATFEAKLETSKDSPRYAPPTVRKTDRLTAITGAPKVTTGG